MLKTIVSDYKFVTEIASVTHPFNGNSAASKEIVHYVFPDVSQPRSVLDIGFGVGELARTVKTNPKTAHWQVDGIDGFEETCRNVPLFERGWYRNVWHGLAQDISPKELASYDMLCLFDVIKHLDAATAKQLLKNLLESLGEHSRLVISTPLWFYPQDHNRDGDLEEHLIGVPGRALLAMNPLMYLISPNFLIGNFVFGRESLKHIDEFVPTTDRGFGLAEGLKHLADLGVAADGILKIAASAHATAAQPPAALTPAVAAPMKQTPAHNTVNLDLLALIPPTSRRIVEVGCMQGALAQAYRSQRPEVAYVGVDIDRDYARVAAQHCTQAIAANIETMDDAAMAELFPSDCWIFGDCLEHLRDPWRVLQRVRSLIASDGTLLVCIPNAQHWSVQWRLASGNFRYEDNGLMDRTHIRWFTRTTVLEMFGGSGWAVETGISRKIESPHQAQALDAIRAFARGMSLDPEVAATDASVYQYIFKLRPA